MLRATYTDTGIDLEYCPEPLDLLLSDRVCTYARAQRPVHVQPMSASLLLAAAIIAPQSLERFSELVIERCDRDWVEVTLEGLWITEDPDQEIGIFMTELDSRLEQRLWWLWRQSQPAERQRAIVR